MTRNIIFDMGGVVLPMHDISRPIARFASLGLKEEDALRLFSWYGQQGIFLGAEDGSLSPEAFLSEFEKLTGRAVTFEEVTWAWRGFVDEVPPCRLAWLDQLRAEGYHVALLSNTNPFLVAFTESPAFSPEGRPMSSYFHAVHYSYELGACKPDPRAFTRMLAAGGYEASECLFLDDAMHNVLAAQEQGIPALHVPDNQDWWEPLRARLLTP